MTSFFKIAVNAKQIIMMMVVVGKDDDDETYIAHISHVSWRFTYTYNV